MEDDTLWSSFIWHVTENSKTHTHNMQHNKKQFFSTWYWHETKKKFI